jgi:hypothetical protein
VAQEPPHRRVVPLTEMTSLDLPEERVIYQERFQFVELDFRGKLAFARYDCCEFVKCTLLIDAATEQLAFTGCVFQDCNIDQLVADEKRGFYVKDNLFDRPIEERRLEFDNRLAQALSRSKGEHMTTGPIAS